MFRFRTISARLILAISLIIATACALLGTFSILQQRSLTRLALDQQLRLHYESLTAAIDYEGRTARAISTTIAALQPVANAAAAGDRDALVALLGGAQEVLKSQGVSFLTLHSPSGTVQVRLHERQTFGDNIAARRPHIVTTT